MRRAVTPRAMVSPEGLKMARSGPGSRRKTRVPAAMMPVATSRAKRMPSVMRRRCLAP